MDVHVKTRTFLDKKSSKMLKNELIASFGNSIDTISEKGSNVETGTLDNGGSVIFFKKEPFFFKLPGSGTRWVPFIDVAKELSMKQVMIDQPAVPYIASGADVMRPGVVNVDDNINEGDIVAIIDEKNHVIVAIGVAMFTTDGIKNTEKGKVVKTVHHVGDKYWTLRH